MSQDYLIDFIEGDQFSDLMDYSRAVLTGKVGPQSANMSTVNTCVYLMADTPHGAEENTFEHIGFWF